MGGRERIWDILNVHNFRSVAAGDSAHEVVGNEEADDDGAVRAEVEEETSRWR